MSRPHMRDAYAGRMPRSLCVRRCLARATNERTNDTDGRSWSSRDPSLTLINAQARVHPESGFAGWWTA